MRMFFIRSYYLGLFQRLSLGDTVDIQMVLSSG